MNRDSDETEVADAVAGEIPHHERRARRAALEQRKLEKRLVRLTGQAIGDFGMIAPGDRVMVCVSGGKDSYALLEILRILQARAPLSFELVAVNLDQKQPGFPAHVLPEYLRAQGVAFRIETQDTYSIVRRLVPEGKTTCSLCSRLRRGVLYRVASELGATKIALGHHRDDILGTFFLNLFYGGRMKAMAPKLVSDDGRHIVIRPLAYIAEADLARYAQSKRFPIIACNLCGSQENLKRKEIGRMIEEWQRRHPGRVHNVFHALARVTPSHLLDRHLFDFAGLQPTGVPDPEGDCALDEQAEPSGGEARVELVVDARAPAFTSDAAVVVRPRAHRASAQPRRTARVSVRSPRTNE